MKNIINLPLQGSMAFLLNDIDMWKLGFGISYSKPHILAVCDSCMAAIHYGSYIYVPVMNNILCQRCFEDWQKNGEYYKEDDNYQNKYALYVVNKLGYKSLNDIPTIEYDNVNTDSDDIYSNLSNKELKEIYDDIVADDEISIEKEL